MTRSGPALTLVVADDDPDLQAILSFLFDEDPRFEVVATAPTGEETLAHVERLRPDLLLLDLAMPNLDGREVMGLLASRPDRPVVIAMSGLLPQLAEPEARAAGVDGFLQKVGDPDVLIDLIHEQYVLARQRRVSGSDPVA